jgi:hypothetical protein
MLRFGHQEMVVSFRAATLLSVATSALDYVNARCAARATARVPSAQCAIEIRSVASKHGLRVNPLTLRLKRLANRE